MFCILCFIFCVLKFVTEYLLLFQLSGTVGMKEPVFELAQAIALCNPQHTFLFSFDYHGAHSRYRRKRKKKINLKSWLRMYWESNFKWTHFFEIRFGYEKNISHYPFDGGVSHSDDLIYLFPYPQKVVHLNEEDTEMAQSIIELWTSFMANGIPELKTPQTFQWPAFTSTHTHRIRLNEPFVAMKRISFTTFFFSFLIWFYFI